ncbi:hypothetical protein [Nesterenkonia xinjiangensis]|uniref:Uncharacterized protein n=1 Tax=Nesterenkonia xinjiangensis TaxID=225327 RepID=A0A7Z0GJM4_9MICC|nr:hypothetical protein [Nesterenkonia xinjiangensis]NYJ77190.1 hypothetical protein [Nesterenkonia xinjiangensis]
MRHYREPRGLTRDELTYVLHHSGYDLDVDDLRGIEDRLTVATVDAPTAIAYVLEISPADLLTHIPVDQPVSEGSRTTGLPCDVETCELHDSTSGKTSLDRQCR